MIEWTFNKHFLSDFVVVIHIVVMNLINLYPDLFENFKEIERDQKEILKDQLSQYISTF